MAFNLFGHKKKDEKQVQELPTAAIVPNRYQPRKVFQEDAIKELAATIKDHGLLQPIIVREYEKDHYEIIAGERRFRAVTTQLHWEKIPAIITTMADDESAAMAIIENLQRAQLSPVEEARAYADLMAANSMTQETLARQIGKSQSFVANKLRLLKLSETVQAAIMNGVITERHGREMLKLDVAQQADVLHQVARDNLTVKETAALVETILHPERAQQREADNAALAARVSAEVAQQASAATTTPDAAPAPAEPVAQPTARPKAKRQRRTPQTKDTRLAVNTIKASLKLVRESGMKVKLTEENVPGIHRLIIELPDDQHEA